MKILKIAFRNINSLKGDHEIDFTKVPFTTSSLFAITGPTGSGKSTILDVISLALFNKIPRLGSASANEIKKTGAIITRNQKEAMASVTYLGKTGVFRSEWSISTARTGNLRDYQMQISNAETGEILDLKKSDVPKKNEGLIGLNYDQFIKSVLLAQGEFARFLKAPKSERGDLLEKITGTGIYRQLGRRSFDKFKIENQAIEAQQHRITAIKEELLEEEYEKALVKEFEQKEEELKKKQKQIDSFKKQLDLKNTIAAKEKEKSERQIQKVSAKKELEIFDSEYGLPLRQHEKIAAEAEKLRNWSQLKKEAADLEKELESCGKSEVENSTEQKSCLKSAEILTGTPIASDAMVVTLENFGKKVNALQEEKRATGQEYTSAKAQLMRELQGIGFQINENKLAENLKDLLDLRRKSEKRIAVLKSELSELELEEPEKAQKKLTGKLEMAREAQRKDDEIKKVAVDLAAVKSEEDALAPKITALPADIEIAKDKTALYQMRLENFELQQRNQLLLASLEQHRHRLQDGEACPLCGALEHPYAKDLPEKSNTMDLEIANNRKELKWWGDKLATSKADLKNHEKRFAVVQKQHQELAEKLAARKTEFSEKYKQLVVGIESPDWEAVCKQWKEQIGKMEEYRSELGDLETISAGIPILESLQKIFIRGIKLKQELEDLYRGKDIEVDISEINTRWIRLRQAQKHIGERLSELQVKIASKSDELVRLETKLLEFVKQHDFQSIAHAWKALMPESECNALRSKRAAIQNKITAAASSLELIETQLSEVKKTDSVTTTDELKEKLIDAEEVAEVLSEECKERSRQLKNHADNLKRLKELAADIFEKERKIRKWRLLNELIGDATGKKFNDFAQDLSLSQLLQLANIRLKELSDRYLIDKPRDDEDDGLTAIDKDMGGQRRSVKTLSGGETFILSLSMALALSDLASRNVEINSLFIDEGFGTLDHETLDQTLDTLERLQAESSKTIGIISHVDSLKERINTQIQLTRNGQGYSSLEVVQGKQNL